MTKDEFNKVMREQIEICSVLMTEKNREYAEDHPDKLAAFKTAAALQGISPRAALMGMLAKHLVSVSDMCNTDTLYTLPHWEEKITDVINYMLLLKGIVVEELQEAAPTGDDLRIEDGTITGRLMA